MNEAASASLSRILGHTEDRNIGIISASRGRYPKQENKTRTNELATDIRGAGFGFVKMSGHYIEGFGQEGEKTPVTEEVFFVIGKDKEDSGHLKSALKKLGAKYDQESILFKPFGDPKAYIVGTTSVNEDGEPVWPGLGTEVEAGTFHPNKVGQFFTKMKSGKTFVFEGIEIDKTPMQHFSEYIRRKYGE